MIKLCREFLIISYRQFWIFTDEIGPKNPIQRSLKYLQTASFSSGLNCGWVMAIDCFF